MKSTNKHTPKKNWIRICGIIAFWILAGALTGILIMATQDSHFLLNLITTVKTGATFLFPYYIPILILLLVLPAYLMLKKAKSMLKTWDGEDEITADWAEMLISISNVLIAACIPIMLVVQVANILYAAPITSVITFAEFIICGIMLAVVQRGIILVNNLLHPDNLMNFYDINAVDAYEKGWDEAERKRTGEAAWVSYKATVSICFALDMILLPLQLLFDIGILPTVVSSVIMLAALISFTVADYKLSKKH